MVMFSKPYSSHSSRINFDIYLDKPSGSRAGKENTAPNRFGSNTGEDIEKVLLFLKLSNCFEDFA